jgi:PAS domain S-box-containing protein
MESESDRVRQLGVELESLRQQLAKSAPDRAEFKRLEERLQRFEIAVENMQVGLTITDTEGKIVYTNPADARMHGYQVRELLGRDVRVLAPRELHRPLKSGQMSEISSWARESVNVRADGSSFVVHLTSDALRDSQGETVGFVTTCIDITDRKQAELELRLSEARYRALIEHATHGIYRADNQDRFVSANPALVRMLGYDTEQEVLDIDPDVDLYQDPAERSWLAEQYGDTGRIEGMVVNWKRRDGNPITVRLSGRRLRNEKGGLQGTEVFAEDMTKQMQLEQQVVHSQKIEVVGQLTGGIAHDFNNLLTVILASASMIESALQPGQQALQHDLRDLQAAARRGSALVRRLLSFSRRAMLSLQPLDLTPLVKSFMSTMQRLLPETIEVEITGERHLPHVSADPNAVEQIVSNLVNNARDAMPKGGRLVVETSVERLDEAHRAVSGWGEPGEYVCLTVSDTGVGMDQETRTRIFEPFYTTKERGFGTGLGMSTVYGLIKQHRGFVEVSSEVGQGTSVKVFFRPVSSPAAPYTAPQRAAEPEGGTETILVVEDEAPIRRAAKRVLERFGYDVIVVANGEDALDALEHGSENVDLVISDVVMPGLSGTELRQAMLGAGMHKKFILMSGYSERDVKTNAGVENEVPFLQKPWTPNELLALIRDVLDEAV